MVTYQIYKCSHCGNPFKAWPSTRRASVKFCKKEHFNLWRNERPQVLRRFNSMIEKTNNCWMWRGALNKFGYGVFTIGVKYAPAHRASFSLFNGEIPPRKMVLHTCDMRSCVRPNHLFLGDAKSNALDCMAKGRHTKGEMSGMAKLCDTDVITIRELCKLNLTAKTIASKFKISRTNVYDIKSRRIWKHI